MSGDVALTVTNFRLTSSNPALLIIEWERQGRTGSLPFKLDVAMMWAAVGALLDLIDRTRSDAGSEEDDSEVGECDSGDREHTVDG